MARLTQAMLAASLLAFTLSPLRAAEPEPVRVHRPSAAHQVAGKQLPAGPRL